MATGRPRPVAAPAPRHHHHAPAGPLVTVPAWERQEEPPGRPASQAARREEAAQGQRCWLRWRWRCWWQWWWCWRRLVAWPRSPSSRSLRMGVGAVTGAAAQHRFCHRCRSQDRLLVQEEEEGPVSLTTAGPWGHPWAPSLTATAVVPPVPRATSVIKAPTCHPAPSPPAFLAPPIPAHSPPSSALAPHPAWGDPRAQPCPAPGAWPRHRRGLSASPGQAPRFSPTQGLSTHCGPP